MESNFGDSAAIPQKPPIHSGEIAAALTKSKELQFYGWDTEGHCIRDISEMEMEQVLQTAFNWRHERYNGALRHEAEMLKDRLVRMRQEIEDLDQIKRDARWAQEIQVTLREFLDLVKGTRVIRIASSYQRLRELMNQT